MPKVLLLGSSGFVGHHIRAALKNQVSLVVTTRIVELVADDTIHFDFQLPETWNAVLALAPDVIINASGYGVIKEQTNLESTYDINYRLPSKLIALLQRKNQRPFWIQIGTAFEYKLEAGAISENTACVPLTHYGISKFMLSNFLLSADNTIPFIIIRPFAMFGPYESVSKLVPSLILAQKKQLPIPLSNGEQRRDYFYVKDLAYFVKRLIQSDLECYTGQVVNLGRGIPIALKSFAEALADSIPNFTPEVWQWGAIPQRTNENDVFYNSSDAAAALSVRYTPFSTAFAETVAHYYALEA